jgi:peptidoglycan/LPS O-acetylase OafA/YrhL
MNDEARRPTGPIERRGLVAVGVASLIVGVAWLAIAVDPRPEARVAFEFRPFAAAVGLATLLAGALMILRRREELVMSVIGALTGAAFAVGTALLTRPETKWTVYAASVVFGALLLGALMFRGGFDRRR